ncbi:MAG: NAD-specific glutamate dehydrogenase [Candidatus Midichloria mitochondrii]|uniref:NAD-glutamate dehydrogenase n=1 Tax=Midichloria mitochondrii (strain IricVA) TaxID=696127 RepID=F7XW87_MIDMI|nr:NAD-glutamate dehydrogenase domain-containing protein [Candidatus Midichloria mitochondrii]AEI88936.1 NAD-glutamate dehydrogenase [Candidatus Midichloria mitochondrii IricVA]MDJ1287853.1 NAD-glutamate dehydrogenase [Candidatus Midichloria mitochondrii]MDJ1298686.1 NAD-glutamate dehydrogenase [Candidatus Midichloria mitochondrii]MDJ1583434.1 NAD-glutamate dehydrogenase [Candidatus Midichloria mitochondrii]
MKCNEPIMSHTIGSFLEEICKIIPEKNTRKFCKALYSDVPLDAISLINTHDLAEACISIFESLQYRSHHSTNINFTKLQKNPDLVVLEIITKEVPFLVESLSNELKKQGITIHLIVHPTIPIERKKSGELIEVGKSKADKESVMQFFVSNQFSDDYYNKLKSGLKNVIECVEVVVEDWQAMQQQMKGAIKNITAKNWYQATAPEKKESIQFLEWLLDNHFIFLGSVVVNYESGRSIIDPDNNLGMTKSDLYRNEITETEIDDDYENVIFIKKSNSRSIVHRDSYMDCIQIKQFDKQDKCVSVIVFIGFFTSSVHKESVRNIPLIRNKINNVLSRYGYNADSYNAKELVSVMEDFSRSDLVQMSEDELFEISTGMVSLNLMPRVKVFLRQDRASQLLHCFIFIPKAKFTAEIMKIVERIISQQIYGTVSRYYVNVGESQLARIQIVIKPVKGLKKEYNVKKIEELVNEATSVWLDNLLKALQIKYSQQSAIEKFNKFKNAFDLKYTSSFAPKQAVHDIKMAELATAENQVKFDFYLSAKSGKELLQLKIFSPYKELPLSLTLPTMENFGFFVIDTLTFKLALEESTKENTELFIHHFRINTNNKQNKPLAPSVKKNIETALEKIYAKELEDGRFNSLMTYASLSWKEAIIIRAYSAYLKQINFLHNSQVITENLINYPDLTNKLIKIFHTKFSIDNKNLKNREATILEFTNELNTALLDVPSLTTEQIFKTFIELIHATKRTNFFQKINTNFETSGLSFKISSGEVSALPLPKPFREIFVYSSRFEAIHLRGGKIARGGLRWSDRKDDFRTEILGLMKAQMTKNSVIVPVGSKGGFILKNVSPTSPDFINEGIACYKDFLRSVLDITDNVVNNKIVPPPHVIRYDEDDPYLVVAADKGTASFSDHANAVSKEYDFWLGDAFASGGSAGYDHKKMGITARGAWISAQDHASQFGINIVEQPFTAIGIGDMAGDVFGNGLLLSKHYKLIAAFNHIHIFIDPNPDSAISFKERERLFNMPRSQWTDYDSKLISKGGGVFLRSAKNITISEEACKALGVTNNSFTPDELVKAILKAPVDIFWNGGIGTYIKSAEETNAAIGDKSNDNVRVNGADLRCKAVIEGGNLGATQLGRIEYARKGGKINTDFIDNSAGVDCSDHEVNIKIAFADLLQKNAIEIEERNKVLFNMTEEISELVLQDNKNQTLLISLEQHKGRKRLDEHFWLIKNLESRKELSRELEKLPTIEDFTEIANLYGKLSRPEIAILIAYAKNSAILTSMASKKNLDKYLDYYLISYFPRTIQKSFKDSILQHKLKREIIVTTTVNHFVNTLGCCLFHQLIEQGHDAIDIIHTFAIASDLFSLESIWSDTAKLAHTISANTQLSLFDEISKSIEKLVLWLLNHKHLLDNVSKTIKDLKPTFDDLLKLQQITIPTSSLYKKFNNDKSHPNELSNITNKDLLNSINQISVLSNLLDIIAITQNSGKPIKIAANEYMKIYNLLGINHLIEQVKNVEIFDYAENTALKTILAELNELMSFITITNIKEDKLSRQAKKIEEYNEFLNDITKNIVPTNAVSVLVIALKRLKEVIK